MNKNLKTILICGVVFASGFAVGRTTEHYIMDRHMQTYKAEVSSNIEELNKENNKLYNEKNELHDIISDTYDGISDMMRGKDVTVKTDGGCGFTYQDGELKFVYRNTIY